MWTLALRPSSWLPEHVDVADVGMCVDPDLGIVRHDDLQLADPQTRLDLVRPVSSSCERSTLRLPMPSLYEG